MKILKVVLAFAITFSLFGCSATATPTQSASPSSGAAASGSSDTAVSVTIFAASSLTGPLNEIISAYKAAVPDVTVTPSYGGSGTLQTQIENGAPADIFFSAGAKQMNALEEKGLITTSSKIDLLTNEIVLIVPNEQTITISSFNDIAGGAVGKVAMGDPKSVPAGQYAEETLGFLKLWDKVSSKALYGSDVKQVLSWVGSGNADCGIVYKTDAKSDSSVKVIAEAPNGSHAPIVYPIALVKAGANQDAAARFIKFLQSDEATTIFIEYGFSAS